ncbi:uncharacterized protein RSE6_01971 [Rhynchosporium secalis]|uniref:Uncharacterized protein n=1 Tax=Rhynchosporium secalis TaxID=38038 RepID=A0A1E1LZ39_RHYSE|nr:uncharacterized protein RSE6_01971 [Rhynchosporium secalis]
MSVGVIGKQQYKRKQAANGRFLDNRGCDTSGPHQGGIQSLHIARF